MYLHLSWCFFNLEMHENKTEIKILVQHCTLFAMFYQGFLMTVDAIL